MIIQLRWPIRLPASTAGTSWLESKPVICFLICDKPCDTTDHSCPIEEIKRTGKPVVVYIITAFHEEFMDHLRVAAVEGYEFEVMQKPIESQDLVSLLQMKLCAKWPQYQ